MWRSRTELVAIDEELDGIDGKYFAGRPICDHKMHTLIRTSLQDIQAVAPDYDVVLHHLVRRLDVLETGKD